MAGVLPGVTGRAVVLMRLGARGSVCSVLGRRMSGRRCSGVSSVPMSFLPPSGGRSFRCAVVMSCRVLLFRLGLWLGVRAARGHGAVPVRVSGTPERLSLLLGLTKCRGALAGDARLSSAADQGGERNKPNSGSR